MWDDLQAKPTRETVTKMEEYEARLIIGLKLVRMAAWRMLWHIPGSIDDYISDGNLGLVYALRDYDEALGDWVPYARRRIKGTILDCLRERNPLRKRGVRSVPFDAVEYRVSAQQPTAADEIERAQSGAALWALAGDRMDQRWAYLLQQHYRHERTLGDIAGDLGCNESRASQLHQKALHRLRVEMA